MKVDRLYYFESAARNESFTLAAKEYHIAPSAVSQQMKVLEEGLGFSLFIRSTNKKVILTNAGKVFYNRVKEILDIYKIAVEEAKLETDIKQNTLTIGICGTRSIYSLNKVVYQLKEKYSDMEIKLNQIEGVCSNSYLLNKSCDILVSGKNIGLKEYGNLEKKVLANRGFGVLVNTNCILASKESIDFNDLISSKELIYVLSIYEKSILEHSPELKEKLKTEESVNVLFASGYLNRGIILTSYEESKMLNFNDMVYKELKDSPINSIQCLYYLKNNNNWILEELLELL